MRFRPHDALARCLRHIDRALATFPPGAFPYVSSGLCYRPLPRGVPWTAGFWPGQLWLAYARTGEDRYRAAASALRRHLGDHLRDHPGQLDHDIGFQYFLSAAAEHELTGDPDARQLALRASERLVARFNPAGRFIRAHGWDGSPGTATPLGDGNDGPPGRFIVDCLMNLPLLYWSDRADPAAGDRAVAGAHARTSLRLLVRADGWVYQAFDCDPESGEPLGGATLQGVSAASVWTRGQAWAIHGFALAATHLGNDGYLRAAQRLAGQFIAACEDAGSMVAPWDFDAPSGARLPDSSASAIAAAGLLALADADGDDRWRAAALTMLTELEDRCATDLTAGQDGLLTSGCYHYPAGRGLAESTAWGDFFYLEALTRAAGLPGLYTYA